MKELIEPVSVLQFFCVKYPIITFIKEMDVVNALNLSVCHSE